MVHLFATAVSALLPDMLAAADPTPAPTSGSGSGLSLVLTVLITLASGGTLAAIATALFNRSKTKAEARHIDAETGRETAAVQGEQASAAAVLTGSALTLLEPLTAEVKRLADQVRAQGRTIDELERRLDLSQAREQEHSRLLAAYRRWAEYVSDEMRQRGIEIQPPPHESPPP